LPYFVIDKTVAAKYGFDLANFLAGTLAEYTFEKTSFAMISAGLDNTRIPKLSSNKLGLLFLTHNMDLSLLYELTVTDYNNKLLCTLIFTLQNESFC
jgi:hypothetical protein